MSRKNRNTTRSLMPSKFVMLLWFCNFLLITHNSLMDVSAEVASFYELTDISILDCSSSYLPPLMNRDSMGSLGVPSTNFYAVSKVYTKEPGFPSKPQPCIHKKPFTYTFHVSPGPKFIRFHFNPSSQAGFHMSKALFSVSASHFTLLKTSTLSYSERRSDDSYTVKEFCINIDDEVLNITFTPSPHVADAYAFVNKIEVVSMPLSLYIRQVDSLPLIGQPSSYHINNSKALEMMYRLNVGGDFIPAQQDTGMFREWSTDASFLTADESSSDILFSDIQLKQAYFAPEKVHASARIVADHGSNQSGARWLLPVDSGFCYLVRLHFCEISSAIWGADQRVFHVYIKDQTAEDHADVFLWSHGAGIPVYRDYVVNFSEHTKRRKNLSLSIQNSNDSTNTSKPAILNGLEIFKLSDFNDNLAGSFSFGMGKYSNPSRQDGSYKAFKITATIMTCIFVVLAYSGTFLQIVVVARDSIRRRKKLMQSQSSDHCRCFSFDELKLATNNFSDALLLGVGGYGNVYKGSFNGGTDIVAVKRANPCSHQGLNEFETEIRLLSGMRHCHLVSLIGYCKEKKEMILVYNYMANGTLRDHLYNTKKPLLSWTRRLTICIGAARGLHYLQTSSKHSIIHRDVKSSNILLDQNWMAKVSDFGLSKIGPNMLTKSNTHVTTMVKGSFGYLDPEYYRRLKLTEKSDVYSFGVVLFEVLCARPAVLHGTEHMEEVNLAEWVLHCYQTGRVDEIIDTYLQGKIEPTCLKTFIEIGRKCLGDKGSERPTMGEVLWNLEQAWKQQQGSGCFGNDGDCGLDDELSVIVDVRRVAVDCASDPTPGVEFSDIIAPVGR